MDKIKNWFKPDPKAIIQNWYAAAIPAIIVAVVATLSAHLSGFDPMGLIATMNPFIAFLIYFVTISTVSLVLSFALRGLWKRTRKDKPSLVRITAVNIDREGRIAGLRIDNQSDHDVTQPSVTLDKLILEKQSGEREEKSIGAGDREFHIDFEEPGVILSHRDVLVPIAEARGVGIAFLANKEYRFPYSDTVFDTSNIVIIEEGSLRLGVPVAIAEYEIHLSVSYLEGKYFNINCVGHVHFQKGEWSARTRAKIISLECQ